MESVEIKGDILRKSTRGLALNRFESCDLRSKLKLHVRLGSTSALEHVFVI